MNLVEIAAKRNSAAWVRDLSSCGESHALAIGDLHALLRVAALYSLGRTALPGTAIAPAEVEQIAEQCARESVLVILDRLPQFQPDHRFTTWAYKYVVRNALSVARAALAERQ
jgi:RNA polymerase sigma-70 factor (ECF subfamily)